MPRHRKPETPIEKPTEPVHYPPLTFGEEVHLTVSGRRDRILRARARTPRPTYEEIALEVGCCVKTVYNAIKAAEGAADGG